MSAAPIPPLDLKAWTPRQKESLLAILAKDLLGQTATHGVPVRDESDQPVAYLYPRWDPSSEYGCAFTPAYFLELVRRASTPEDAVSWSEFQSHLDSADAVESRC